MTGTLLGITKTENERLLTKWLDNQLYVCVKTFTYLKLLQITKLQHTCACSNKKDFLTLLSFSKNILRVFHYIN
jgi:hypothetical protein